MINMDNIKLGFKHKVMGHKVDPRRYNWKDEKEGEYNEMG